MKKAMKITSALAATAAIVGIGAAVVPQVVSAWGDNGGGRKSYTLDEVKSGVLGNTIVFNSISDGVIGNEKNFVGAREEGSSSTWSADEIKVEEGKTYVVRLYVHNNNTHGTDAVAEDVTTTFALDTGYASSMSITGYIDSSNATPTQYWDSVKFTSANGQKFYLDYVEGSALLENNGVGANGGVALSDSIITKSGSKIGYSALDGKIPGCFEYASYVTIKVTPVFTDEDFTIEKTVRLNGTKTWYESVDAKVGDKVDFNIYYKNTTEGEASNVMIKDLLPDNMELVGDVMMYNTSTGKDGAVVKGDLFKTGINIGDYAVNGDAIVRFTAQIVDDNLECGKNTLTNYGVASVGDIAFKDPATVNVTKECEETCETNPNMEGCEDEPEENCDTNPNLEECKTTTTTTTTTSTPKEEDTPTSMPKTGPAAVVSGILGLGSTVTAGGYYIASRKQLR